MAPLPVRDTITIQTDHKALCYLMSSNCLNKRLRGFALSLQGLYQPGPENGDADGLSRQAWEVDVEDEDANQDWEGDVGDDNEVERDGSVPLDVAPGPCCAGSRLAGGDVGLETERKSVCKERRKKARQRKHKRGKKDKGL